MIYNDCDQDEREMKSCNNLRKTFPRKKKSYFF